MRGARFSLLAVTLTAAVLPAAATGAGIDEVKRKIASERISLELKDAAALDIFKAYKQLLGVEVQIRCPEERRVSIAFENLTVLTSLNAICESAGLSWSLEPGEPPVLRVDCEAALPTGTGKPLQRVMVRKPGSGQTTPPAAKTGKDPLSESVTIELEDADLAETLGMAARLLGAQRLVVDNALGGRKVTFKAERTTVREFMDAVCSQAGATWELEKEPVPTLKVRPKV